MNTKLMVLHMSIILLVATVHYASCKNMDYLKSRVSLVQYEGAPSAGHVVPVDPLSPIDRR